jgi:hypothetical protein
MKILSRCIKNVVAIIVLLLGSSSHCYAAILGGTMRNLRIDPIQSLQMSAEPEPATMLLLGVGLILLAAVSKKGKKKLY